MLRLLNYQIIALWLVINAVREYEEFPSLVHFPMQ